MRVFALSDVHVDYALNAQWFSNLSKSDYRDDALIMAGDISDDPSLLEWSFELLSSRFRTVLYVPGNHDLWVIRGKHKTSFDKYLLVCQIAKQFGIVMEPFHAGSLSIVPLNGWYDYSFGLPTDELRDVWADYHACVWPTGFDPSDITRYFCAQNRAALQTVNDIIISFSHFVPRLDLIPFYVPRSVKTLFPVLGSRILEDQIRWLKSTIHVYGHSHLNRQVEIDGISYINNALGYPSEMRIASRELLCIFED